MKGVLVAHGGDIVPTLGVGAEARSGPRTRLTSDLWRCAKCVALAAAASLRLEETGVAVRQRVGSGDDPVATTTTSSKVSTSRTGLARRWSLLADPGEMRARCRALDWAATPLKPAEQWPSALHAAVWLSLDSGMAMCIHAGPELMLVYNDGFARVLGGGSPTRCVDQDVRHQPRLRLEAPFWT